MPAGKLSTGADLVTVSYTENDVARTAAVKITVVKESRARHQIKVTIKNSPRREVLRKEVTSL